jgi:glycosyltransferase involved in cell wall biosynthesis
MSEKRICFVTNEYHPVVAGGIGMLIEQAVSELSKDSEFSVTVLLVGDEGFCQAVKQHGQIHYPNVLFVGFSEMLASLPSELALPQWAFTFENYYYSNVIAEYLLLKEAQNPFDVIEFPDYKGLGYVTLKHRRLRGKFLRTHFVARVHGATYLCNKIDHVDLHSRERLQLYMMEQYTLAHADSWTLAGKKFAKQYAIDLKVPAHKLNIVTPVFKRLAEHRFYWMHQQECQRERILFYGKLQHVKGVDLFVEAALELLESGANYEFLLVGQDTPSQWGSKGFYGDQLKRRIPAEWEDHFNFMGRIDINTLSELVAQCRCAVIPSRMETFCLAAHELNWLGIPLILNRISIFEDYFEDEKTCSFFDGTSVDLAGKIKRLVEDEALRTDLRQHNNAAQIAAQASDARQVYAQLEPVRLADVSAQTPLVSIIIPYYNDMRFYLEATLESVEKLSYPNVEVLVINDGSTQPAANAKFDEIAAQWECKDGYTFYRKPNGGLGDARNFGIERAKGEFIYPLDSDDVIEPELISDSVQALQANPELAAVSCYVTFFSDGSDPRQVIDYVIPYDLDATLIFSENRAGVACSLFRASVFDRFSYDNEMPAFEDWDLWMQLAVASERVEVVPRIGYRYRRRAQSMVTSDGFARKTQLMHHVGDKHASFLKQQGHRIFKVFNHMLWEKDLVAPDDFPHLKIYFAPGGRYSEHDSMFKRYRLEEPVDFEIRLPNISEPTELRFDPVAQPASIHVFFLELCCARTGETIWKADKDHAYACVQVAGTARTIDHPDHLLIASTGYDPQLLCPRLEPRESGYILKGSFRVFDRFESLLYEQTGKGFEAYQEA